MSKLIDLAEWAKTRIETVGALAPEEPEAQPALAGLPVIIERQNDIVSEIEAAVGKMSACITIYPTRGGRARRAKRGDPFSCGLFFEVYATPLLQQAGAAAADDIAEAVILAFDGVPRPGTHTGHPDDSIAVEDFELVPDKEYVVWRIQANCRLFVK